MKSLQIFTKYRKNEPTTVEHERRSTRGSYTEALNTPLQGAKAVMIPAVFSLLDEYLDGIDARLISIVHDEFVLEVAEKMCAKRWRPSKMLWWLVCCRFFQMAV